MSLTDFLQRITARRPMVLIDPEAQAYERYFMGRLFGAEIWLHHFQRPDADRHVHDHPWSAISLILVGGYIEELLEQSGDQFIRSLRSLTAPAVNMIRPSLKHRIARVSPGTWTLMIVGKRHGKGWGHYPDGVTRVKSSTGTPSDWWRTAGNRDEVYAGARNHPDQAVMREADACAWQTEENAHVL